MHDIPDVTMHDIPDVIMHDIPDVIWNHIKGRLKVKCWTLLFI